MKIQKSEEMFGNKSAEMFQKSKFHETYTIPQGFRHSASRDSANFRRYISFHGIRRFENDELRVGKLRPPPPLGGDGGRRVGTKGGGSNADFSQTLWVAVQIHYS